MEHVIRSSSKVDLPAVLALWRHAAAEPTHTDDLGSLSQLVDHDPGALMVADESGRIVGSVIAAWDGWRGSIYRLVVAPDRRRHGLGRLLLFHAERRLADAGAVRVQAIVVSSDPVASGFWSATAWSRQAERSRFVKG
jgi:ribosomal protein S18 acetylase RimI-like enzyme